MGHTRRFRSLARWMVVGALFTGILAVFASPARAAITTPGPDSTVRGNVTIHENSGGQDNCVFGNSGDNTRIEVWQGGTLVLAQEKGDGGSFTVTWSTVGVRTNGGYNIRSLGRNISNGFFSCNTGSWYQISSINVTLDNRSFLTYNGPSSAYTGESFTASATLSLENGYSAAGRVVTFSLDGQGGTWTASTNSSGFAAVSIPVTRAPGGTVVRATYAGDAFFSASSAASGFTVLARPTTITNVGDTSVFSQETASVAATLRDTRNGAVLAGRSITFDLLSGATVVKSASAVTNAGGTAATTILANVNAGSYSVRATFGGETNYLGSTDTDPLAVLIRPTSLVYSGPANGYWQETATLTATLVDVRTGTGLAGKQVSFTIGAASVGATTNASGVATANLSLNQTPGSFTVVTSFGGDPVYGSSGDSDPFAILKRPTVLAYTGDTSGYWTETATVSAVLTDVRNGSGIAGKTIVFDLGNATVSATTNTAGVAIAAVPLGQDPGLYPVTATFNGDAFYVSSFDATGFSIDQRPTALVYDGATSGLRGHTVTLSATLTDTRLGSGLAGKTVHFALGSFAASATTDGNGQASVQALLNQEPGTYTVSASFADDGFFLASSDAEDFLLGWEYTFTDKLGRGRAFLNTSTKEFRFASGSDVTSIKHDPTMKVISLPDDVTLPEPPAPPCDPNAPEGCLPPVSSPCDEDPELCTPPSPPCDPLGDCLPPAPCDPNAPEGCLPDPPSVPECADDPTGGDPICPADYLPPLPMKVMSGHVCVENPIDATQICAPDEPEVPAPPCDESLACIAETACDTPQAEGCSERFAIVTFSDAEVTLAGFFDLQTGMFVAAVQTANGVYQLHSDGGLIPSAPEPPALPCDPNAPEGCVPPAPEPPCDIDSEEGCLPPAPEPPAPPCDANDPTSCVPPAPEPPSTPECVDDPLGGEPICKP